MVTVLAPISPFAQLSVSGNLSPPFGISPSISPFARSRSADAAVLYVRYSCTDDALSRLPALTVTVTDSPSLTVSSASAKPTSSLATVFHHAGSVTIAAFWSKTMLAELSMIALAGAFELT